MSPTRIAAEEVDRIVSLYRARYKEWNVRHFHERAVAQHGLTASHGWAKSVLHASGEVQPAPRRGAHRKKRPRKPVLGMMLHQDGSRHLWLPALGRQIALIVTMDDATSKLYSVFLVEEEGTWSSLRGGTGSSPRRAFMVEPAEPGTALVPWTRADLDEVLCQPEERVVDHDNTVSF